MCSNLLSAKRNFRVIGDNFRAGSHSCIHNPHSFAPLYVQACRLRFSKDDSEGVPKFSTLAIAFRPLISSPGMWTVHNGPAGKTGVSHTMFAWPYRAVHPLVALICLHASCS